MTPVSTAAKPRTRHAAAVLTAAVLFALTGCSGNSGEPGGSSSTSPSASPSETKSQMTLLGPDTSVGTAEEFLGRDRCENASDYIYISNALVQNAPIKGDFDVGDTLENAFRRLKTIGTALTEQVPTDQTADARDLEQLADLFITSYEPVGFRPDKKLLQRTQKRAMKFQPSGERLYAAQIEDCSGEVPNFAKGLFPPA